MDKKYSVIKAKYDDGVDQARNRDTGGSVRQELESAQRRLETLTVELAALQSGITQKETALLSAEATIKALQLNLNQLEQGAIELNEHNSQLTTDLKQREVKVSELTTSVNSKDAELRVLEQKLVHFETELQKSRDLSDQKVKEVQSLQEKISALTELKSV